MIRTPPGWSADIVTRTYHFIVQAGPAQGDRDSVVPVPRIIGLADLRWALARGVEDFRESRTDVIFLCLIYPLVGLLLARLASGYGLLPLLFPLASGFALVGPLAAVGLNEMSRRREMGMRASWADAFGVFGSRQIGGIVLLGGILLFMLLFWLVASEMVYELTLGPKPPVSFGSFAHDVIATPAGWTMVAVGVGIGFVLAVVALTISVVSFPMLLDRNVSLGTAVQTSVRVVARNPMTIAAWGLIIDAGLILGSIPLLLGLAVVMPVLGHATWHLYRRVVPR
jgi:uncharacterized membrane protein